MYLSCSDINKPPNGLNRINKHIYLQSSFFLAMANGISIDFLFYSD